MRKIAIIQSNYIPWKGYFDLIDSVDAFMLFDAVQYTRRDWRNRNLIKTPQGLSWLTVPVEVDVPAWAENGNIAAASPSAAAQINLTLPIMVATLN